MELPLTTERLTLRLHRESDATDLLPIYSRPDVARFLLEDPWTPEDALDKVSGRIQQTGLESEAKSLSLVMEHRGTVVGTISLWTQEHHAALGEVGWTLDPSCGGQGFASEAAEFMVNLGFSNYSLHRIEAQMDARNTASARLAERIGMVREAHLRQNWWPKGEWTDTLIFAALASEWETSPRPAN